MRDFTDFILRQAVRHELVTGKRARFAYIHPDNVVSVGDLGAICIVPDSRVGRFSAWVTSDALH